jgi:AcrR family transcriptional regulator
MRRATDKAKLPAEHDKREAILAAALDLFEELGFHAASVPAIAERARVAAGTIYHYFDSKDALVNAIFQQWKGAMSAEVLREFPFDRPPREQFRTIWERMADFALAHPREVSFLEFHQHAGYLDATSLGIEQQILAFGIQMIERAQASQALKPISASLLMQFVNGAFLGVFRGARGGRIPMTRETMMIAEQCCWEALRA